MKELQSLLDYEPAFPGPMVSAAFDASCAPGCTVTTCSCTRFGVGDWDGAYWSSTTWAGVPDLANFVEYSNGEVYQEPKSTEFGVRAVRGGA